jgi:maleate cis-trans isomerase
MASREPSLTELEALAEHTAQRVALYRRRMYLGRGTAPRLAEIEREADGAAARLRRAREAAARPAE